MYKLFERYFLVEWLFCFALVVLARIPYLISGHAFIDGDEAVIGIMSSDLLHLRALPIYFYGQQYGFSFFEVLAALPFIAILGQTVLSLKLGGMLIFSLGIQRLLGFVRKQDLTYISYVLLAVVIVLFPAWQIWGTKLRGGYITSFVGLCFMLEYLFQSDAWKRKDLLVISSISAIIAVSQPFFLVVLAPILLFRLLRSRFLDSVIAGISGSLLFVGLRALALFNTDSYSPAKFGMFHWDHINKYFLEGFWSSFTGFYSYTDLREPPEQVVWACFAFSIIVSIVIGAATIRGSWADRRLILFTFIGMLISVIPVTFALGGCRYLLPFHTGSLLLMVLSFASLKTVRPWLLNGVLLVSGFVLVVSTTGYKHLQNFWLAPEQNDVELITELISELDERQLQYGFVADWQATWQLNYLCYGRKEFRFAHNIDRVQRMIDMANECYFEDDCTLAAIGTYWPSDKLKTEEVGLEEDARVNARFFILTNPSDSVLIQMGFHLPDIAFRGK